MIPARNILLVEDNPEDANLAKIALEKSGIPHEVTVVDDGVAAVDYLFCRGPFAGRNPKDQPAVTLLDLKLPKKDGIEVLRELRSDPRTRFLPVVILTSSKEDQDLLRAYENGCNSYVRKPVSFLDFSESIKRLGIYWLLTNETAPVLK